MYVYYIQTNKQTNTYMERHKSKKTVQQHEKIIQRKPKPNESRFFLYYLRHKNKNKNKNNIMNMYK
jgi:hypothetical protein